MYWIIFAFFVFGGTAALAAFIHLRIRRAIRRRQFEREMERPSGLSQEMRQTMAKFFPFYAQLDPEQKNRFEHRVAEVLEEKKVRVQGINDPAGYVALVFAVSLVQLTFGLADYILPHFRRIIVVPDSFVSPVTGKRHRGEVNSSGLIMLSWKHLAEGIANPLDGVSLGLHELAHALYLENFIPNEEDDFFSSRQLKSWRKVADETIEEIRNHEQSFLRDYAGTNRDELFAVSVEYFFEQPTDFEKFHPLLFAELTSLLNMDPRRKGNPVLEEEVAMDIDGD